ncbi:MAG: GNAT family N-acetyltransferase [Aureispira sp.]
MSILIETPRLILRALEKTDVLGLFELDSQPKVHEFIGTPPLTKPEQALAIIKVLQQQYQENGIGRYAVIDKASNNFLGWCGLKLWRTPLNGQINFYELGYRFIPKYWGKGYATESAQAWVNYGFDNFQIEALYAITDPLNVNSKKVLQKVGFTETEEIDWEGEPVSWFELERSDKT